MDKAKRKLRGFTLLELVIVIAIMAILAGILVPNIISYIRTNRILAANDRAHEIYVAAQEYLTAEQIKGTDPVKMMPASSTNKLSWIIVTTEIGSDPGQADKSNKTTLVGRYNISDDFYDKTTGTVHSYRIADGIERRLAAGFSGTWMVAYYPSTFTVAYAVYNDYYATASEREAAVKLIGTNNGATTSDADCVKRLYTHVINGAASTKYAQESDFMHPEPPDSEAPHMYTGQFPVPPTY